MIRFLTKKHSETLWRGPRKNSRGKKKKLFKEKNLEKNLEK